MCIRDSRFLARKPVILGNYTMVVLLAIPLIVNTMSFFWTQDYDLTLRSLAIWLEAFLAYIVVINVLNHESVDYHLRWTTLTVTLLLLASVLMWLRFPGFAPQTSACLLYT